MASTITLTFNTSPEVSLNETLSINVNIGSGTLPLLETFKLSRFRNYQSAVNDPYDVNQTATNYASSFNLDYSNTGLVNFGTGKFGSLVATSLANVVTITLNNPSWLFLASSGTAIDNGSINSTFSNDTLAVDKNVTIASYSENTANKCNKTDVELTIQGGDNSYSVYVDDVLTVSAQTSPVTVIIDRGIPKALRVVDSLGSLIGTVQTINTRSIIEEDINITIANYTSGATVSSTITFISAEISVYTYSLDNVTFQSSSTFTGQTSNNYILYVKDGFGCVKSKSFIVDGVTVVSETVFDISEINSFRFAKVESGKKNQKNTLSFNELRLTKYGYTQKYLANDVITTQFKTNANYINCYSLNNEGVKIPLTAVKKTSNINLQAKSTSTYFNIGNGRSAIYFGVVNSLNYLTNVAIEQLNYGSSLPIWANTEGNLVTIDGLGQVPIDSIGYSESKNSFILEFNIAYTGADVSKNISAEYNIQPYEIYEFNTLISERFRSFTEELLYNFKSRCEIFEAESCVTDFVNSIYPNSLKSASNSFNVLIEAGTDIDNIDFTYVSECINEVSDSDFLFDITYYDDENKGKFNYQTGIKNKLRIFGYQDDIGEQETEGYNGDKEYYVTDNVVFDVQRFTFLKLSTQMANKLRLVFAHKYVIINRLSYKLSEPPEVTGDGNYNMKKFVVNLKQSGEQFLTTEQELIIDSPQSLEIGIALASAKGKGILAWTKNY
jgi:hypothetical protein